MKKIFTFLIIFIASTTFRLMGQAACPANNTCATAYSLTPSSSCTTTSFNIASCTDENATGDCTNGSAADNTIWFSFTSIATTATVTVVGGSGFDAVIGSIVTCGASTTPTGGSCTDASGDAGTETLSLSGLTIGTTYKIGIHEYYGDATGTGTICVQQTAAVPPAAGEDCANPIVISAATSYCGNLCNSGCQTAADIQPGNIAAAFCGFADDLFYLRFVASATSASFNITAGTPSNIQIDMMQVTGGCTGTWSHAGTTPCLNGPASIPSPVTFAGLTIGNTYYLVIDNVSGSSTSWCFSPTSGVLVCDITGLTATPTACASNLYNVSGSMNLSNPPSSGTLAIKIDGVTCQTLSAPFAASVNYSCTGLSADGTSHTITAVFSADSGCTENVSYTAPAACTGGCSANNGTWN